MMPTSSDHKVVYSLIFLLCILGLVAYFLVVSVLIKEPMNVYVAVPRDFTATTTTSVVPDALPREIPRQRITFTGDIMLGRHVEYLAGLNGIAYVTAGLSSDYLDESTAVVVNFESAMADPHVTTPSYGMQFSTATSMLSVLNTLNVTHASLANNHTLDHGTNGYENTRAALEKQGIESFGHATELSSSSVTYLDLDGLRIGVLGLHTLFAKPDETLIRSLLADLSRTSDIQFVYVHWGTEYMTTHAASERRLAEVLVAAGVEAIIGHHPHVTQDIELIDGVPVFYSLGNFIFDQYFDANVREGYNLHLTKGEGQQLVWTIEPHISQVRSQPRLQNPYEKADFLTKLARRSDLDLSDQIIAGRLISSFTLATSTEDSMITE